MFDKYFLPFLFFKLTTPYLLACLVSDKKYTIILIVFSEKNVAFFPFGWFEDSLFITVFKQFDFDVPWCRFLCVSFWSVLSSLDLWLSSFSLIWKILAIISSNIFLSHLFLLPTGECHYMAIRSLEDILTLIDYLFICFFVFPLFFIFGNFCCYVFKRLVRIGTILSPM